MGWNRVHFFTKTECKEHCIFYLKIFWFITIPLPSPSPTLRSGLYSGNVDNWDSRAPKSPKTDVRLNKSLIKRIIKANFCSRRNYRGSSCVFFFYLYNFLWEKIEANSFDKLTKFIIYNNWLWHVSTFLRLSRLWPRESIVPTDRFFA